MFDHTHYVPILKAKEAEFKTLSKFRGQDGFSPLVELVNAKGISHFSEKLSKCWVPTRPVFVDLAILGTLEAGTAPAAVKQFFTAAEGMHIIPVIGANSGPEYIRSLLEFSPAKTCGFCFRLDPDSLANDPDKTVRSLLAVTESRADQVDLLCG